ncbi:hypothetical protein JCM10450v2_001258 [Rhodotorula kratochvilovae]
MWRVPHLFFRNVVGNSLVWMAALTAGSGFLLFGYDQGVMGGLITLDDFLETFPDCRDPDISGITVAIYEIGCLIGAICCILFGDRLGRKNMVMLGMTIMIIGAVIMSASYGLPEFIIGRIVSGIGNGMNTATIPSLQGELAPPEIRGALVLISGALVAAGIALAYAVGLGFFFVDNSATWRFPLAFQIVLCIMVMLFLFCIPESPAWLVKHGQERPEYIPEAKDTLAKLYKRSPEDDHIGALVEAMEVAAAEVGAFHFRDLFTHGPGQNFRRATLGFGAQALQQLTGVNLISYYATTLFERIGLSPLEARIVAVGNGVEYAIAGFLCIRFVDTMGRRSTMIWGTIGCGICMVCLTALVWYSDRGDKACGYAAVVFLFLYNTSFSYGWLGSGWLYPSEVSSLPVRAQANGISTCANWLLNFVVVMVVPPGFANIGAYTYLIFGVLNLCLIAPTLYLFFPETARRSLEEIDLIFAEAYNDKSLGGYVKHSLTRPPISGRELDLELQAQFAKAKGQKFVIEHVEDVKA